MSLSLHEKKFGDLIVTYTTEYTDPNLNNRSWRPIVKNDFKCLGSVMTEVDEDPNNNLATILIKPAPGADDNNPPIKPPVAVVKRFSGYKGFSSHSVYQLIPPEGYVALGDATYHKTDGIPSDILDTYACVRSDLADLATYDTSFEFFHELRNEANDQWITLYYVRPGASPPSGYCKVTGGTAIGTFGARGKLQDQQMYCLKLKLETETYPPAPKPKLTSSNPPLAETETVVDTRLYIPFGGLTDQPLTGVQWKLNPFYAIERRSNYNLVAFTANDTDSTVTYSDTTTTGTSETKTKEFTSTTSISIETGFDAFGASFSASLSQELGFGTTNEESVYEEKEKTIQFEVPPRTAVGMWMATHTLAVVRLDGSVVSQISFKLKSEHYASISL